MVDAVSAQDTCLGGWYEVVTVCLDRVINRDGLSNAAAKEGDRTKLTDARTANSHVCHMLLSHGAVA